MGQIIANCFLPCNQPHKLCKIGIDIQILVQKRSFSYTAIQISAQPEDGPQPEKEAAL